MKPSTRTATPDTLGLYLREIRKIPLLTPEQEVALARRVKAGERKALDELVRRNLRFVVSVAKQYAKSGVSFEDLINEGNLGLIRAAERFDVDRGYRFISYAVWWVRQAILQYVAEHSRTVRLPINKSTTLTKVTRASQRLSQTLGRDPIPEEPAEGRDHEFQVDTITDESSMGPEDNALELERNEDIEHALAALNAREGDILRRYFGLGGNEPHTLEEIGKVYKLTRERVRQIRDRAIWRLRHSPDSAALAEYAN